MKTILYSFMLLCVVSLVTAQDKQAEIDQYLESKFVANEPGVSVLVVQDGKILLRKGYGMASLEKKQTVVPDNIFRIGSVTKQFTSTAILKLAQEKKLNLSDDITKHLSSFNAAGNKITIEQLLNHTSGIKSYTSLPEIMTTEGKAKKMTVAEMLAVIEKQPHDFSPGERYLYNNSGYFLLGAIIEKVSGMSYQEYVTKNFFKPLKMNSSFATDENLPARAAVGYQKASAGEYVVADYVHPSIPFSAGCIFSTSDDLWKWNQAVFSGKVVKQEWLEKAWMPTKLNNGSLISYGYGWQLGRLGNRKVIGHGGAIDGFLTFELYVPELKLYVCVLENSTTTAPEGLAYEIARIASGDHKNKPVAITVTDDKLNDYVGVYQVSETEDRVIRKEGTKLTSQRSGGTKFEIYPVAEDQFAFKDSPSTIKFIRDNGKIIAMELTGQEWIIQRDPITNKPLPAEKVEIEIDPLSFDAFVGEYELAPGFIIKVWREEKAFKAQATGQPAFQMYAKADNEFFLKVVDAQIVFNKDESGGVTSMTLYQNGREIPGKKIK